MKEVMAIIRPNKANAVKQALLGAGFPAYTCRKVLGRGKNPISIGTTQRESLIPKRLFTIIVDDDEVETVVDTIISANNTERAGDGKIFVMPLCDSYKVRNGKGNADAY